MEIIRKTIGHMIDEIAQKYSGNDALIHTEIGVSYKYDLLRKEIERAALGMIEVGIKQGDRVALWAPNIPQWLIAQLALAKIGAIVVPVDPGSGRDDLLYILAQSGARAVIMAEGMGGPGYIEMIETIRYKIPALERTIVIAERPVEGMMLWSEMVISGNNCDPELLEERAAAIRPEDPVAIMYTSGTTGQPKGVVLDHIGLINKSIHSAERQGLDHEDRLCLFFPLFHMFGNTCIALAGFLKGAAIIMPCHAFEPRKILWAIEHEGCTAIYGSPSMVIALLDHPDFNGKGWRNLRKGTLGGAPCPMELMKRIVKDLGVSDITVAYGITETSSWITMTHPDDPLDLRVSTAGRPLDCSEVKIVDPATGIDLPPKKQGELCTKGFLMKEYYKMPAATAAAVDKEGWFHTGDLGEMDEQGYLKITGRLKDVIVRDSVEIHPTEIEEIIYSLPDVSEVQVFGFPHKERGQEIAAWIKLKEGSGLTLEEVSEHAAKHLEKNKVPEFYRFVSEFPMTRSGKVQKFRLAEMAKEEYGSKVSLRE